MAPKLANEEGEMSELGLNRIRYWPAAPNASNTLDRGDETSTEDRAPPTRLVLACSIGASSLDSNWPPLTTFCCWLVASCWRISPEELPVPRDGNPFTNGPLLVVAALVPLSGSSVDFDWLPAGSSLWLLPAAGGAARSCRLREEALLSS